MKTTDLAIVGGGPAGLCAAITAADLGAKVVLIEQDDALGGQLVKQTHMFFGSEKQHAGTRGIDISSMLVNKVKTHKNIEVLLNSTAMGYYPDAVLGINQNENFIKIKPQKMILATGASEKMIVFPNNDLPGVYGAGAVQTLMNVYGIKPGNKVLMVGAGNIGLIVSYQLLQAGVDVAAIVEASPNIGGYLVHASKIRRLGVPILTSHTIVEAIGEKEVTGAVIAKLDEKWNVLEGSEQTLDVDTICLAVGLTPLTELIAQGGGKLSFIKELSGYVPVHSEDLQSTIDGVFVAGDLAGVEEASSAMVEGKLAGAAAAKALGLCPKEATKIIKQAHEELHDLRSGPVGVRIREGIKKLEEVRQQC
ncbi:FAD-dependent oxidoreductase [Clostridium sp. 'deep sea']|uniref:NAD(P)/FAD-dependent oxidoreductase n=1 Tax=Clostridium sp. 'deep sea' TaxID=2779445 RepID=UPI0018968741|nr:NAD(P)/FAD-dependent oxidoreductase [Clostridium sp. 'deep sea']QOR34090.1 FAD-dependent oxidoreductase [Clostridium sp. 'deep sea']